MATPKKESVFLVSCYDLQAHALRRQARCWTHAGHPVELLFFKRPGRWEPPSFSYQEAALLAQEIRRVAPGFILLSPPSQAFLEPLRCFLQKEMTVPLFCLGANTHPPLPPDPPGSPDTAPCNVCLIDYGKLHRLSPKKSALLCP